MTCLVSVCFLEYLYGWEACLYLVADRTFSWVWWPLHDLDLDYYLDKREHLPGKDNDGLAANSPKMPVIHLDSGWLRDIHHSDGSEHVCIRRHNRTMFGLSMCQLSLPWPQGEWNPQANLCHAAAVGEALKEIHTLLMTQLHWMRNLMEEAQPRNDGMMWFLLDTA